MNNWQTIQPVDFTEDGDTTSAAIKKHDIDITNIYELLHRVRRFDFSIDPPADPVEGHLWVVDGGDNTPIQIKMYYMGQWRRLSFITMVDWPDNPFSEGCLCIRKDGDMYFLEIYYHGQWENLTAFAPAEEGKMVQLNTRGVLSRELFQYEPLDAPTTDTDLDIGKRFNYRGTGQTVNLHINANNGLYRITYAIYGGTVDGYHRLYLNNTSYPNNFVLLASNTCENNGEVDEYGVGSSIGTLYTGTGKLGIFSGIVNTKSTNISAIFKGHADQTSVGMDDLIIGSYCISGIQINKLGYLNFLSSVTYRVSVERLL